MRYLLDEARDLWKHTPDPDYLADRLRQAASTITAQEREIVAKAGGGAVMGEVWWTIKHPCGRLMPCVSWSRKGAWRLMIADFKKPCMRENRYWRRRGFKAVKVNVIEVRRP